ncbi:dimethylmenaquinone methyltransferase [Variovorax paradoxus]|jgi:FAD/FMN-containing dehydrogenase/Fe-S oxidoreductase|uniref:FAD-binding and (Fe-S)-binding domain-containing protein n=1 Tax=Variovorax paradoxus TaxID=34073 RepID=UPI0006E4DB31|nr:dimethylmenaquinone methyltransferase [Variovorax paradoxus]KPV10635.1 dimethylmenaquinone methyltransferase [Variovorax paradoxus]KPV13028.1 dimethylmenaquinone methyltransferase [Variovorax paradoxus]KPV25118.1 dimethylmenaquinone methyltransferase [Variovorax paradoxus]KPV36256.1 dimethylmenaquinone methyltransferase [Variovorax paradoxus]
MTTTSAPRNWAALERELRAALGDSVRFDDGHRAVYASDASNYRQVPIGVVVPRSIDEFAEGVGICHRHQAPVLLRGGGTSMGGQTVNVAVVFDLSAFCDDILALDPIAGTAVVEPGVVCDKLIAAAERHGLTFAPDPSTHSRCTLGGMIANNSCGPHSVMAGKTLENVEALEVMTYDGARFWVGPTSEEELSRIIAAGGRQGEIYAKLRDLRDRYAALIRGKFPDIKRRVSGYNLDQLLPENGFNVARALVGTEGTCALTLRARVRLVRSPPRRVVLVLGFPDIYVAADAVPEYQRFSPIAIEGLDRAIIRGLQARNLAQAEIDLLPEGDAWVMIEFGADSLEDATAQAQRAAAYFSERPTGPRPSSWVVSDPAMQRRMWSIRENGASATQLSIDPSIPDPQVGWEDAAVDPLRLGDYLRAFQALVDRYGYRTSLFGHFGDGCVHARITFNLRTVEGVAQFRAFIREAAQLVVDCGGSLTGEHGDGQARAEFLPIMFGEELMDALREFKRIWDPSNRLNPGKVVDAYRVDDNLRMGPRYKVVKLQTRMDFRGAEGDGFQRAVEHCVGMGRCRSTQANTMCPSYRATKEERFSTRGRSRLFWEMLQGDLVKEGWNSEPLKEALDTCLACKGCRSDCPTHTDMASYKAEFLSHYYEQHMRPRQAMTMGRIGDWAPLAGRLPWLANLLTQTPGLSFIAKRVAGVAADRDLPRFAAKTFRRLSGARKPAGSARQRKVILWVDTFCEHFHPEVASAAVEVLADAGFEAMLPATPLCCGRPLYDFGYLDLAREKLRKTLAVIDRQLDEAGDGPVAVVGLEPGCMSVFKDELLKMFPDDARARRLADSVCLLGDFLHDHGYQPARMEVDVLVHAHCHQKSLFGTKGEVALLQAMGARAVHLDSGCCGMAGSFGFNPEHIEISKAVGELVLLPAVRAVSADTVILTNGFSCREQIRQGTGREVLHLAEFLLAALRRNARSTSTV